MRSTTRQRDELVLDLYYNQNKTYREIAKEARICPRDIKRVLDKDVQGVQGELPMSVSSKAYKLFCEGKSPLECAKTLNLREPEVTQLYKECWNLTQLYDLNQIYLETKGHLGPLMKLYRSIKHAGMDIQHILKLLRIANNDLPSVEHRYENLKTEVNSLQEQKRDLSTIILDLTNQRTETSNYVGHYKASCRQEEKKLKALRQERAKEEALVKKFENNNLEYVKIKKTAEEKVLAALSDRKGLLKLALLCLTQSMRNEPEKYNSLIQYGGPSRGYSRQYYGPWYMFGQQQYQSKNCGSDDYMDMLVEEADKLWNMLSKELVDKIISDYSTPSTTSLLSLPPSDEESKSLS